MKNGRKIINATEPFHQLKTVKFGRCDRTIFHVIGRLELKNNCTFKFLSNRCDRTTLNYSKLHLKYPQ